MRSKLLPLSNPFPILMLSLTFPMSTARSSAFAFAFGTRSLGSTALLYHRHQSRLAVSSLSKRTLKMSTSTSFTTQPPSLLGKKLVTAEQCLAVYNTQNDIGGKHVFVDGSWHLSKERNGRQEYEQGPRIKNAKFFDIDDVASKGSELNPKGLPHMMPPKKLFAAVMDALGITNSDDVIIYGTEGCMFTARAWCTFRAMGHEPHRVHLMQGSLREWEEKGGEMDYTPTKAVRSDDITDLMSVEPTYNATDAFNIVTMEEVLRVVTTADDTTTTTSSGSSSNNADAIVVDARGAARFRAEAPEPREGMRGGHMPGSYNVPFTDLLRPNDGTKFKTVEELRQIFDNAGVDVTTDKRIICSCGSGVTACVVALALEECGRDREGIYIYDGSWSEWGSDPNTPIVS